MKGQSFEVFKIVIGAVFSISLLLIGISYLVSMSLPIDSYSLLKKEIESAYKAKGKIIENIIFYKKGQTFTSDMIKNINIEYSSNVALISCSGDTCKVLSDCSVLTKAICYSNYRCKVIFDKLKE